MQNHRIPFEKSLHPGFRLHKLEVLNWGTFDRQVYTVRPNGSSALLIGENGSGKSTLVDALLTLLVRPGVRNFNVASGAKKRERDERSYLLGAFDRGSDEEGSGIRVKYLRQKGDHYSVILASFVNEDTGKAFTLAQFLYLSADASVDKIYCLADDERSIQDDFSGLESTEGVLKALRNRGFRATRTFQEFEGWFTKATRVKPKAMEVFNQTVAVKDIQRLNDFIRDHMLERRDWDEKVDRLLGHFTQLSEAHDSLVRARLQLELLEPVARVGADFRRQSNELGHAERLLAAAGAYFSQKRIDLFVPAVERSKAELEQKRAEIDDISTEIELAQDEVRKLRNEIERAGGDRLREIPALIQVQNAHANNKRQVHQRFCQSLAALNLPQDFADESSFNDVQKQAPVLRVRHEERAAKGKADRERLILERGEIRRDLQTLREEFDGLSQRRENIPQWCVSLRSAMCDQLGLPVRELPFAAELMQVKDAEKDWEASIEKVLRGFALSMLVPERYYHLVATHVDRTRLIAHNRGQRLVYFRVAEQDEPEDAEAHGSRSLIGKLKLREGHSLIPWLKAELAHRFDYLCCETVDEFQKSRGLAMTKNRHVKSGQRHHDKDDRESVVDPRNFVLGWDNKDKKKRIAAEIERLILEESRVQGQLDEAESLLRELQTKLIALTEVERVTRFADVDFASHDREIASLERERVAIEDKSDAIRVLKQRLAEVDARDKSLQQRRLGLAGDERELANKISQGEKLVANARAEMKSIQASESIGEFQAAFVDLETAFSDPPLSTDDVFERERRYLLDQESRIRKLHSSLDPVRGRLTDAMGKFLRACPEEAGDLSADAEYLDSFLGLRQRILDDDLPQYEQRFKERLNQKVIEEIGLFRSALEQERRGIEEKIELLNVSLRKLEYRPGTHIQLEPRQLRDAEIVEFQGKLRECVEGSFEDSAEANEARFGRVKELVVRLRDDGNRRWRDKVTDVRRWFDFWATVIDRQTMKSVSVYQDSQGQSGGEKAKLAFTILVAAIAYQYDLDPEHPVSDRFHFVVVDEMFSKVDDRYAEYALELFKQFGLQLLIVAPLDAKARVTQPYVGSYLHVVKKDNRSAIFEMTAREFEESVVPRAASARTVASNES